MAIKKFSVKYKLRGLERIPSIVMVEALNETQALEKAKICLQEVYGKSKTKQFIIFT